ncbi:MAG TPA: diaminopimelate epimerase [Methanocorpusculum sp.]|nr:diaminopimelate epimerase [Methanocorpusculum sp.]
MEIAFTKLHGNGNDFILIDEMKGPVIPDDMKGEFAKLYCDRKFGIGADGVLFIGKSTAAAVKMMIMQPDGSEAEMCGNGIRCLAKYAFDNKYTETKAFLVETKAGILKVRCGYDNDGDFMATIDMGEAKPGNPEKINGYQVFSCNTGVPHAVIFVDDVDAIDIMKEAPEIRSAKYYPEGTNVNFVQVTGADSISVRTFERGVEGETLSCGTGSTASAFVAVKCGKVTGDVVHVKTVGGPLDITVKDSPLMTGPAETVFTGVIRL